MFQIKHLLLAGTVACLSLAGCNKEPKPQPQITALPNTIVAELHSGHLHDDLFHGNPDFKDLQFPLKGAYTLTLKLNPDGKTYSPTTSEPLRLEAHTAWSVEIAMFDAAGTRLNPNYLNGQYRFFLSASDMRRYTPGQTTPGEALNEPLEQVMSAFQYRDTNPEAEMYMAEESPNVHLTGIPVGFKGFFNDPQTEQNNHYVGISQKYVEFNLVYTLMYFASAADKAKTDASPSAYDTRSIGSAVPALSFSLPIRIITERPSDDGPSYNAYISDIAKEYGLTAQEVEKLYEEALNVPTEGDEEHEYHM